MANFEWDETKNQQNYQKHGLNFQDAELIFKTQTISFEDEHFNYGEQRYITLGQLEKHTLVIVHTVRNNIK